MTTILKDQEDLATDEREESVSNMFWPMPSSTKQGKEEASLCIIGDDEGGDKPHLTDVSFQHSVAYVLE